LEPLDHIDGHHETMNPARILNTVLIFLPFAVILFTVWSVWWTKANLPSPWLPEYTAYYMNGTLINLSVILSGSIIPAFLFRWGKYYILSSVCVVLFYLAATVMKHDLELFWYFVG
jgi:hypothetical protein